MTLGPAPQPVLGVEEQEVRSKGVISLTPPLHDRQVDEPQAYNLDVFHKSFFPGVIPQQRQGLKVICGTYTVPSPLFCMVATCLFLSFLIIH